MNYILTTLCKATTPNRTFSRFVKNKMLVLAWLEWKLVMTAEHIICFYLWRSESQITI